MGSFEDDLDINDNEDKSKPIILANLDLSIKDKKVIVFGKSLTSNIISKMNS